MEINIGDHQVKLIDAANIIFIYHLITLGNDTVLISILTTVTKL